MAMMGTPRLPSVQQDRDKSRISDVCTASFPDTTCTSLRMFGERARKRFGDAPWVTWKNPSKMCSGHHQSTPAFGQTPFTPIPEPLHVAICRNAASTRFGQSSAMS
eukprot:2070011-Amphidinium_carterae.2